MTGVEAQLLFGRALLLVLLYGFLAAVGWLAWAELRRHPTRPRAAGAPPARLIVLDGADSGWPVGTVLPVEQVTIVGRDLGCSVVVNDGSLSGRHAALTRRDGDWWLEDLASTNGTYLNGERLRAEAPALARSGDVVQLGAARFRLVVSDAPAR